MVNLQSSLKFQVGQERAAGAGVAVDTKRFHLRTLQPSDASRDYLEWIADPEIMTPLNMPPRKLTMDELRAYIASFDNKSRHLIGMFDKGTGTHFGVLMFEVSEMHGLGKMAFLIGHADFKRVGAFRETAAGAIAHMFEARGLEKVTVYVMKGNEPSMKALEAIGFSNEGTLRGQVKSLLGDGRLDQYHYGLLCGELILP